MLGIIHIWIDSIQRYRLVIGKPVRESSFRTFSACPVRGSNKSGKLLHCDYVKLISPLGSIHVLTVLMAYLQGIEKASH